MPGDTHRGFNMTFSVSPPEILWLAFVVARGSDWEGDRLEKTSDYPPFNSGVRFAGWKTVRFILDSQV